MKHVLTGKCKTVFEWQNDKVRTPLVAIKAIIFFFRHQLPSNVDRALRKLKSKPKQDINFISDDELPF